MSPPGEIRVINPESRAVFRARPTGLYAPSKDAYQYRIEKPFDLVVLDITTAELVGFMFDGKPIPVKRYHEPAN